MRYEGATPGASAQREAAAPDGAKLRIDNLAKRYGEVVALEPTSLDVRAGEFLTLLGPSGSGKTTLLQMICGLVEPSAGRILIDGQDATRIPVHKREIGLVFQHYALFPHLTVGENVRFPLRMRRRSAGEIDAQVAAALEMVQLAHLADRFPRELSGGQQQRVALARCFVYQPAIILMDEPLGALDKKLREHMQLEIRRLHRETGTTIVYVTHDQEEALALSDRICLMNHARVEQLGTPRDIYDNPRSTFAADFIGISNLFRGGLGVDAAGQRVLTGPEGTFRIPHGGEGAGDAAILVRPEMFEIGTSAANRVSGVVVDLVYAGAESRMLIRLKGGMVITVRVGSGAKLPYLGEMLTVGWEPERAVLIS